MRGIPGGTHCGKWTKDIPADLSALRLVCTRQPGHLGRHRCWSGHEWRDREWPTKPAQEVQR